MQDQAVGKITLWRYKRSRILLLLASYAKVGICWFLGVIVKLPLKLCKLVLKCLRFCTVRMLVKYTFYHPKNRMAEILFKDILRKK
jgi:hypothetical protein